MISNGQSRALLGVVIVVILLSTTLVTFFVFMHIGDPDEKYKGSHEYIVSGSESGLDVTGDGVSEYIFEPKGYVYLVTTTYSNSSGTDKTFKFSVICDSKDGVAEDLYDYVGETTVDDRPCKTWKCFVGYASVEFSIDTDLVVHKYTITDEGLFLEGRLKS
jgi:hypothetical protein